MANKSNNKICALKRTLTEEEGWLAGAKAHCCAAKKNKQSKVWRRDEMRERRCGEKKLSQQISPSSPANTKLNLDWQIELEVVMMKPPPPPPHQQ